MTRSREWQVLVGVLGVAIAVSVVHYVDNVLNYGDYPTGDIVGVPAPPDWLIAAAWVLFTACGVAALTTYRRGRRHAAAILLAAYSGSGLVGIGHYLVEGASAMPWWRHTHVVADIACAVVVLALAYRIAVSRPTPDPA